MGIEGAPTCVMSFEDAAGWLVGEPHRGLACMFTMMNHERLAVGLQGSGSPRRRTRARSPTRASGSRAVRSPARSARTCRPIPSSCIPTCGGCCKPPRAWNEGARAFAGWVGLEIDRSTRHPDPEARRQAAGPGSPPHPGGQGVPERSRVRERHRCQQVFGGAATSRSPAWSSSSAMRASPRFTRARTGYRRTTSWGASSSWTAGRRCGRSPRTCGRSSRNARATRRSRSSSGRSRLPSSGFRW